MNPFRVYMRVKIQEDKLDEFLSSVPEMIDVTRSSEPKMLQFEAFLNREKSEVIWLESFTDNSGMDFHIENPALETLKMKMMPMNEALLDVYTMGSATQKTNRAFKSMGVEVKNTTLWEGTNRLNEERQNDNVQAIAVLTVHDMTIYRKFSEKTEKIVALQPGFLYHRSHQISDNQVLALGEWANVEKMLAWFDIFNRDYATEFQTLIGAACGVVTSELQEVMASWNAPVFERVDGFVRY